MTRKAMFDALRQFAPGRAIPPADIPAIDALAERWGVNDNAAPDDGIAEALALIKQFEGCRLKAYPDPGTGGAPWTIGWGATGPGIAPNVVWTQAQADDRLAADVARFAGGVNALLGTAPTTPSQRGALISFAYNVGLGALKDSTLRRKHLEGDYTGAAAEFARWDKASGKVLAGLTKRRAAEAAEYRS